MGKRIVIIDDDSVILDIASLYLTGAGYQVEITDCGLTSNSLIFTNPPPDLIMVDVMMPLLSGDEKLKSLKNHHKTRNIPVVLMSAKSEAELSSLAKACGADGYLTKPFTEASLIAKVQSVL